MTTISAVPTLDLDYLPPEDTMELASSPNLQHNDLDLDLDSTQEDEVLPEDSMVEDVFDDDQLEVTDHLDDVMFDGDTAVQHIPDGPSDLNMEAHHKHETVLEDEDILYEDDEVPKDSESMQPANDSVNVEVESTHTQGHPALMSGYAKGLEAYNTEEYAFAEEHLEDHTALPCNSRGADFAEGYHEKPVENDQQGAIQASHAFEAREDVGGADDQGQIIDPGLAVEEPVTNTNQVSTTETLDDTRSREEDSLDYANTSVEEPAAAAEQTYSLGTQDVALHTVKVIYQDNEICLFPPHSEESAETFFLSDHGLAHEPLNKLLTSCREILADTIGDDDELVLDVASLGLHISEGSKYADEITLSQILDVYLQLSHNDGIAQIEPLYCSLNSRVCLASQYAYLAAAAQEGKTITEVIAEHMDSPEFEDFEEQPAHDESTDLTTEYYKVTDIDLPAPDQSKPRNAQYDETATDAKAHEPLQGQTDDHPGITQEIDDFEAIDSENQRGITDNSHINEPDQVDPPAEFTHNLGQDEAEIEPHITKYQEDIDEGANDDQYDNLQEQASAAEQFTKTAGVNDETASSDTVEAETKGNQAQDIEESFKQEDNHLEQHDDDSYQPRPERNDFQAHDEQQLQALETESRGAALIEDDEGLLDLGPENLEQPFSNGVDLGEKVDETGLQSLEDNEDLFDEVDASTDQTLDNTQGDDEDDLDAFFPPATPAKTNSTKRKVEADDEDEFDLLDSETPDKKRRRPS